MKAGLRICIAGDHWTPRSFVEGLVGAGHSVAAVRHGDLSNGAQHPFSVVATVSELCADREVLLTKFRDDDALANALLGANGLIREMPFGSMHVILGMHDPAIVERVAAAHAQREQQLIAAPLLPPTGQEPIAVAGGDAAVLERVAPLFEHMGIRLFRTDGPPSVAITLALTHFAVLGCAIQAMAEAFALARSYGVEAGLMHEVMVDGLFAASAYRHYGAAMVQETYDAPETSVDAAERALRALLGIAERNRIPLPTVDACRDRLLGARAHGDADRDWTVLNREQARSGGLR